MLGAVSFRALACLWRRGICFLFNPLSHTSRFLPRLALGMVPRLPLGMVSESRTMSESRTIATPACRRQARNDKERFFQHPPKADRQACPKKQGAKESLPAPALVTFPLRARLIGG